MAKNEKKVPGAVIGIVAVVVAAIVFVPTVYMPYTNKKPTMDAEHEEAEAQLAVYDEALANQATIEEEIAQMEEDWEEYYNTMFVDASSSLDDIQQACDDIGVFLVSFQRGDEQADPNGAYSFTGNPLYYVTLNMNMYVDRDTLIELLQYIEDESVGCYYVSSLSASTITQDTQVGTETVEEGSLNVSMQINLYYYNQNITVSLSTDEEAETEE